MNSTYLKILVAFVVTLSLTGCDTVNNHTNHSVQLVREKKTRTVWDRLAQNSQLKTHHTNSRVKRYIGIYSKHGAINLVKYSERATPYIYHIMQRLDERNMPIELALLPIIESEYQPFATSNKGASGLWQLASITGRAHGLKQDDWHDQRKDIEKATEAALNYLQYLVDRYDGDWLLALAAYNSGHGRIDQALKQNKRLGKPRDFWSLNLPTETTVFVPKFLALCYLVQNAHELGIKLAPIENKPYFTTVTLKKPIDLHKAASMAQCDVKEVKKLNPAIRTNMTHPNGPHKIVLPIKNAYIFRANYVSQNKAPNAKATKASHNKSKVSEPKKKSSDKKVVTKKNSA